MSESMTDIDYARRAAKVVYLVADEVAARDISRVITALCDEVERLQKLLAGVEALHSSFPLYTVPCEHDEDCNCIELSNGEYYEDHHEPACETCSGDTNCREDWAHMTPWPCPTVLAARGEAR